MKYSPMIMGAESVRGILEGRKTMTRRVVTPQPPGDFDIGMYHPIGVDRHGEEYPKPERFGIWGDGWDIPCPYGQVGDRIWCKETWGIVTHTFDDNEKVVDWVPDRPARKIREMRYGNGYYDGHIIYRADGDAEWNAGDDPSIETKTCWESPLYMPRLASRLTLEITGIRVERLQNITEDEALSEGVISDKDYNDRAGESNLFPCPRCEGYRLQEAFGHDYGISEVDCTLCDTINKRFRIIWDSLNAKRGYPWTVNPWVWVIEFRRVEA